MLDYNKTVHYAQQIYYIYFSFKEKCFFEYLKMKRAIFLHKILTNLSEK